MCFHLSRLIKKEIVGITLIFLLNLIILLFPHELKSQTTSYNKAKVEKKSMLIKKSNDEWKKELTPEQYQVLREKGTEKPFSGKYWNFTKDGVYKCAACGVILFNSETKFDAGCGWPSFNDVINSDRIITKNDPSFGMHRIEVMCANCGGHLGHVFNDGPQPSGLRYCINSVSIEFDNREGNSDKKKN